MKKTAFLLTAVLVCMGQNAPEPAASQPTTASAPAENLPDLLAGAIDPYQSAAERTRFYKSAGSDSELTKEEFEAASGKEGSFVRAFDKWETMLKYDKDSSGKIDWFEAEAYRKAVRASLLLKFDANKDGQLTGAERVAANKELSEKLDIDGRKPSVLIASTAPDGDLDAEALRKYDADGDGKLSETEVQAMVDDFKRRQQEEYVSRYDTNGDGRLDEQELKAKEEDRKEQQRRSQEFFQGVEKLKLKHFDADGDGKLSKEEREELDAFQKDFEKATKELELAQFDLDGDGKITQEEREQVKRQWLRQTFKVMAKVVKYADTNGDGKASQEEMQAFGWKSQEKMLAYFDDLAAKYDRNADGKLLDKAERQAMIDGVHDEIIDRIKKFDADKDGRLSPAEVINLMEDFGKEIGIEPASQPASKPAG